MQNNALDICFPRIYERLFPSIRLRGCYRAQNMKNMAHAGLKAFSFETCSNKQIKSKSKEIKNLQKSL